MKIEIIEPQHPLFADVVTLGKQNSRTLGMFPEGAFRDHARKRYLYGATDNGNLLGYILFRITKSKGIICIAHLCVRPEFRKSGIAKDLLDAVKNKYLGVLRGISLSCRKDYKEASKFWEKYGFKAIKSARSRSSEVKYLVKWWYDFGNSDLFSNCKESSSKINALLDSNIIIKLSDNPCPENLEAIALAADWLTEEVDYFYAPEVFNEINRDQDLTRAAATRNFVHTLQKAQFSPVRSDSLLQEIKILLPGGTDNHLSDCKQLTESIAAGIEYFITLDSGLLDVADEIYERYGMKVLRPADFILFIDQDTNGRDYRSYRLASPSYEYSHIRQDEINSLTDPGWLYQALNEKKYLIREKLTAMIADLKNAVIRVIKDSEGKCLAYFGVLKDECRLTVKLIRTASIRISNILFQQLIKDIIFLSIENELHETVIDDYIVTEEREKILHSFGFQWNGKLWYKIHIIGQHENVGEAKKLYNKFKNYGIYEWKDIYELAGSNAFSPIKVLKFVDTEVFKKPVYLGEINSIMEVSGRRPNTFASPVQVSTQIFNRIYCLGKQ